MNKKVSATVTLEEVVSIIRQANSKAETVDANTVSNYDLRQLGFTEIQARKILRRGHDMGLLAPEMVVRKDLWGHITKVRGWRIVNPDPPTTPPTNN